MMPPPPILRTKLHRPPILAAHLHRKQLLDRLNQGRQRPLTLVSAPAGYGKSTLVSCWLESCDFPSAWVSLDEADNDLRLFLSYFVSAILKIFPAACSQTLSILKVGHLPTLSVLAANLINELDQVEKAFILALDDYHLIRNQRVHQLIAKLLGHPSAIMHLVLIGRRDPPLPLTALRARQQMVEIRTQELRFSLEETLVFLRQTSGGPVDGAVGALLAEKTEGWVTGLHLAALSMRNQNDFKRTLAALPMENRYIMDYLVSEVLSHHPPAIQESLLKISVLNRFCAPLCKALCGSERDSTAGGLTGCDFLDLLDDASLFVIPLDDEQEWYRYHHLFQTLLKRQLKQRLATGEIAALHKTASAWFAEHGYIDEAIYHAHAIGDSSGAPAAELIKHQRRDIFNREQWFRLNRWLQGFAPEVIEAHPDLLLARAWVYQRQASYSELFATLDRLEPTRLGGNQPSTAGSLLRGEVQALKSFQYFATGRAELSATAARDALNHLPAGDHSIRGFAFMILAAAIQMQGDPGQARRVAMTGLQQEAAGIPVFKTMLLAALSYIDWIAADLNSMQASAALLLKHGQKHDLPETVAVARYFTGICHYERNELDLAEHFLAPVAGVPGSGDLIIPNIATYCHASLALALTYQGMGRAEEASRIIESVIGYMLETGNPDLLELCQAFRADLALRQGQVAKADFWARQHIPAPLAPVFHFYAPHFTLPQVLIARRTAKSLSEAEALLSRMVDYYASIHSPRVLIDVLVLQARLHAARGDASQAGEKLTEALALAEPGGFIRPFLDQGPELAGLLDRLLQQNSALPYARHIRNAFAGAQSEPPNDRSAGPNRSRPSLPDAPMMEPLSNREIDVLKILAKGMSNQTIAESLFISPETVKRHLSTVYRKLAVENRHQAIASAKSIGII